MITSVKILLLAVIFVATGGAVFTTFFRRNPVLTGLASIVAIVGSYYLGKSIYDDLVNDAAIASKSNSSPSIYSQYIPPRLDLFDQWGGFHIDGNCHLNFLNSVVARFDYVPGTPQGSCSYHPKFSTSPTGERVIVFIPKDDYGYSEFSLIDVNSKDIRQNQVSIGGHVVPSDAWSKDEDRFLISKQVIYQEYAMGRFDNTSIAFGTQPCVLNLSSTVLNCAPEQEFIEGLIKQVISEHPENSCLLQRACFLQFFIESASFEGREFEVQVRYETSIHDTRQQGEPIISEGTIELSV